jgi:DNA ligase-1
MTPYKLIRNLEEVSSRKAKEELIAQALSECDEFFIGARWAYDSLVTFGVKKVPLHGGPDGLGLPWTAFEPLLESLAARRLTGDAAREAIELQMSAATQDEWNHWYRRILIKDLRCGVTETTINNVLERQGCEEHRIPVFTCQLAHDGTDNPKKMVGEKFVEVKLDGVRVLTVVYPNGKVDQYSRSGKELVNFEHIKTQFDQIADTLAEAWLFDGEVMSSSFQDLMKQVHRKENVQTGDAILHLFDWIPLKDFQNGIWHAPQHERIHLLQKFHRDNAEVLTHVSVLTHELVDLDTAEGQKQFREINQRAIEGGFEGLMLKDPLAPYELKRSSAWLKIKPTITVDLVVVGFEEGTGKNEGRLGALICEGVDQGRQIRVNAGSGFTDAQRKEFWAEQHLIQDQLVEVLADAVTQNQDGSYSLRFPRFVRFRNWGNDKI